MNEPTHSKSLEYVPKQTMRIFVQALLTKEVNGNKTEAQRVTGISRDVFNWNHRRSAAFRLWYKTQCDRGLASQRPKADASLMRGVSKGVSADLRTYYEIEGSIKNKITTAVAIDARDTRLEVNVYPQFDITFQDAIQPNANELTSGDEHSTKTDNVYAVESSKGDLKRLPL